jgi:dTDP-4-dehydrorhamnose reductase
MRAAWESGRTLNLFVDEFRCPIPRVVTARAVWELADKRATGLFHVAGAERLSRVDIGRASLRIGLRSLRGSRPAHWAITPARNVRPTLL